MEEEEGTEQEREYEEVKMRGTRERRKVRLRRIGGKMSE